MSKSSQLQKASEEAKTAAEQRLQAEQRNNEALREEAKLCSLEMDKMEKVYLIHFDFFSVILIVQIVDYETASWQ